MKKLILLELTLLFLATTFQSDNPPGWYLQPMPRSDLTIADIYFLDSLTGHVVCDNHSFDTAFIYKTTDGGSNWRETFKGDRYFTTIQFADNNTGYVVGASSLGIVKKTTNGGDNWFSASVVSGLLRDVAFVNKDTGWVCSTDFIDGGIFKTTNGGYNWVRQLNELYIPSRLNFINKDTGWAACNNFKLYKTKNGGTNWEQIKNFQDPIADILFSDKDTGWIVGGDYSGIIITTNGGFDWDSVNSPWVTYVTNISIINNRIGWVGAFLDRIIATKDGYNWGYQATPSFDNYSVEFSDTLKGWAGTYQLIHTTDGGGLITTIQSVQNELPKEFVLFQNYPNPFNSCTKFKFEILKSGVVKIKVYDISGKLISTLVNGQFHPGTYEYNFDASELTSGVYLYSLLINENVVDTKRMVLIK